MIEEKKNNVLKYVISINETKSKFYNIFYENVFNYLFLDSYIEILFYQEPNIKNKIIELANEEASKYPKDATIGDIKDIDNVVPSLLLRVLLGKFEYITPENFKKHNDRNFIQFFYTEFELYLFKCLKYIYTKRPQIIGNKQVSLKLLLEHEYHLETIIQAKIENVIEQNLREKFDKFFEYIQEHLDIEHKLTSEDINELIRFKQLRNIYAHGDGTITQIYIDKIPETNYKLGERLEITQEIKFKSYHIIIKTINAFDKAFIEKYPEIISNNNKT